MCGRKTLETLIKKEKNNNEPKEINGFFKIEKLQKVYVKI